MKPLDARTTRERAFELDALRGFAIFLMMLHHFAFDLRYILQIDIFAFLEEAWFLSLLRPFFVAVFLVVSGICCSFSRNNLKRGLRMLAASIALTTVTVTASNLLDTDLAIYFNVIHLVTVGTLLFAAMEWRDRRAVAKGRREWRLTASILLASTLLYLGTVLPEFQDLASNWLLPLGLPSPENTRGMADYMPLIPWLGFFFIGAALGLILYGGRTTLFPGTPRVLVKTLGPLGFLGRHSLVFYLFHQPVILAILLLLRSAGVI